MYSIFEGIPYIAGGMMVSSAMSLCRRSAKGETGNSLYSCLSVDPESKWKSSFVAGMIFAATLVASLYGFDEVENTHVKPFETEKLFFKGTGLVQFMISGLLIGFGLKLASGGLTSYAFYGIPRFNGPSFIATGTTLIFAAITATLRSNFHILQGLNISKKFNEHLDFRLSLFIPLIMISFNLALHYKDKGAVREILKTFGIGTLLSTGMMISGLARRHQMLDFLSFNERWNPFLVFVLIGAFLGNFLMSSIFGAQSTPSVGDLSTGSVSPKLFLGCAFFGTGLGISGLTPGAGLLVSAVYLPQIVLFYLPFIAIGQLAGGFVTGVTAGGQKLLKTN